MNTRSFASVVRAHAPAVVLLPDEAVVGHEHVVEEDLVEHRVAGELAQRPDVEAAPLCFMSSMKHEIPSCFGASGSVRASRMPQSACCAIDVQTFWPFTSQPPSTRVARVVDRLARSEPAPGSLKSWHQVISPCSVGGIQRSCCSRVPYMITGGSAQPRS